MDLPLTIFFDIVVASDGGDDAVGFLSRRGDVHDGSGGFGADLERRE